VQEGNHLAEVITATTKLSDTSYYTTEVIFGQCKSRGIKFFSKRQEIFSHRR